MKTMRQSAERAAHREGRIPLSDPARQAMAVLAALDGIECPVPVIAALADQPTTGARRHLRHLALVGMCTQGKGPDTYLLAGTASEPAASLDDQAWSRVTAWHLGCVFEAARVLGAAALPGGEALEPDPMRPPSIPSDRSAALTWFSRQRGTLVTVLDRACRRRDDAQAWRLGLLVLNIACFTGPWDGWRPVFHRALEAARRDRCHRALAQLEEFGGKLELTGGDPAAARACHLRSLELRRAAGDVRGAMRSLNTLGVTWLREHALPEAEVLFTEALALAEELADDEFAAYAEMNLGAVHAYDGHGEQAVAELSHAIAVLRRADREPYVTNALADLSTSYRTVGDLDRARRAAEAGEQAATTAGVPMFLPGPLLELAELDFSNGQIALTLARLHEACAIYTEIGDSLRAERTAYRIEQLLSDDLSAPTSAARDHHPQYTSNQGVDVTQDPIRNLGPAEAGIRRTALPLCDEARVLLRLLAGAGSALPVAVAGALADLPTTVARRHLDHLVRTGAALRNGQDYAAVEGTRVSKPLVPELAAWTRVIDWYLTCTYHAAKVLGAASLPDEESIPEDLHHPAVALPDAAAATDWYQTTYPDLYAVLDRAAAAEDHPRAWRLALLMANVASVSGPVGPWEEALELGLSAARRDGHLGGQGMLLEYTGTLLVHDGRIEEARTAHEAALALREPSGDQAGLTRSTNALGLLALRECDTQLAEELFTRSLVLAQNIGPKQYAADARLNLGRVLVTQQRPQEATALLEQAVAYSRETGRSDFLANALYPLAATHRLQGEHARALVLVTEAVHEATAAGLPMHLAGPLCELAEIHLTLGDEQAALAALSEARAIHAAMGDIPLAVRLEQQIAEVSRKAANSWR